MGVDKFLCYAFQLNEKKKILYCQNEPRMCSQISSLHLMFTNSRFMIALRFYVNKLDQRTIKGGLDGHMKCLCLLYEQFTCCVFLSTRKTPKAQVCKKAWQDYKSSMKLFCVYLGIELGINHSIEPIHLKFFPYELYETIKYNQINTDIHLSNAQKKKQNFLRNTELRVI